jgi:hypothetical protein
MLQQIPLEMEFPDSGAVVRGGYRPSKRTLDLWWRADPSDRAGRLFHYFDVPPQSWQELLEIHASGDRLANSPIAGSNPFTTTKPAKGWFWWARSRPAATADLL